MAKQSISGFPEWLPEERLVEQHVVDTLRKVFELHGFSGIETRAVEPLSELEAKGETSKQVYLIERLQSARQAAANQQVVSAPKSRDLGLHFDLTVPLARYVLQHSGRLVFPLRRYQIQKVWRGERPQEGRFREFTQADIDIVGSDHLGFHHEVEAARVMLEALAAIGLPPVLMEINNRRLLQGLIAETGFADFDAALRSLDKLDKIGSDGVRLELEQAGASLAQARLLLQIAEISSDNSDELRQKLDVLGLHSELVEQGTDELCALLNGASEVAPGQVRASLRIARGLDYYTGSVYETVIPGYENYGSICSGGRYDTLVSEGKRTYPGVGLSIGVSRLVSLILTTGMLTASRPTPTAVMVAVASEESRGVSEAVARALRRRGINTEVSYAASRFGKQIRVAERRGIPFVWFPGDAGEEDSVKDIRSGVQNQANSDSWLPPLEDLVPQVTAPEGLS